MCLSQLHTFLHGLQALERKRMSAGLGAGEGGILHLFRTINTCRELRLLAGQLASEAQTDAAAPAVSLLEELEAQAKEQLLHTTTHNIEAALKTYFKTGGDDMCDVTTRIEPLFAPLPLVKDTHTRKVLVDSVYQNITSLYLRHLLLSNRSQLDKRWSDVGLRVRRDAEELHKSFTQQEGSVEKRCVSLQKISEVLKTNDVNTLKLVLIEIINECPGISGEEQLNTLLRWKGQLSRQQQTEVMDAVVEYCPRSAPNDSPAHTLAPPPAPPLRPASRWYRAMSCLRPPITD
ncbi:uncharacterized protein si:dkey-196h17.9 [Clupea harengus]|uniref:Uncharacterized protein si:dkey-196h17.9 n=1 Tax=Clupea harengus TaxID=7950 RepID=A0A6P8GPN5_CLUHA|nr:uncharacterized protein si:dkey-196h17.9 [Clupea harengus]